MREIIKFLPLFAMHSLIFALCFKNAMTCLKSSEYFDCGVYIAFGVFENLVLE